MRKMENGKSGREGKVRPPRPYTDVIRVPTRLLTKKKSRTFPGPP